MAADCMSDISNAEASAISNQKAVTSHQKPEKRQRSGASFRSDVSGLWLVDIRNNVAPRSSRQKRRSAPEQRTGVRGLSHALGCSFVTVCYPLVLDRPRLVPTRRTNLGFQAERLKFYRTSAIVRP